MNNSDIRAVNELKMVSIDMINKAKSGSPGICLDMAYVMYTLFTKILNVYPNNPNFFNRDRVILSSSHIAPLYYAMLHMAGYNIKKEDLMNYKRLNSVTASLPEVNITPGVDASVGIAGDGVGIAVGEALSRRYVNALIRSEDEKLKLLTYSVFCFCSDADIMSGAAHEAFSFAVQENLDNLVFLYDANNMGADGDNGINVDNISKEFVAMGYFVDIVKETNDIRDITKTILTALNSKKPALIIFKNVIGADSFNAGKNILHAGVLTFDDTENIRKKFNIFLPPFEISKDSMIHVQNQISERTKKIYSKWSEHYNKAKGRISTSLGEILHMLESCQTNFTFDSDNYKINDGYRESLIDSNYKIMNILGNKTPLFLGGSAGLALTTKAILSGDFQSSKNLLSKNIKFGVRTGGMANILNGMALNGLKVFGASKLCFSYECLSGIRMSSLMNLPVTYIFTHDSLYDSDEGSARICVEQISVLRSIPNLTLYRPADINEVIGSWEMIVKNNKPAALIISKNSIPKLPGSSSKAVNNGAYIIKKEFNKLDGIIVATGSEVVSAMQIAFDLAKSGLDIRVVSMPSVELFEAMGEAYKKEVLPKDIKTIVMEASNCKGIDKYATSSSYVIGVNDYAYSGVIIEVLQQMNYDYDSLKLKVQNLLA